MRQKESKMSELEREELAEWFEDLYNEANTYGRGGDKDEQAYREIVKLIKKKSNK